MTSPRCETWIPGIVIVAADEGCTNMGTFGRGGGRGASGFGGVVLVAWGVGTDEDSSISSVVVFGAEGAMKRAAKDKGGDPLARECVLVVRFLGGEPGGETPPVNPFELVLDKRRRLPRVDNVLRRVSSLGTSSGGVTDLDDAADSVRARSIVGEG